MSIIKSILINENATFRIKEDETDLRAASLEGFLCSGTKLVEKNRKVNDHSKSQTLFYLVCSLKQRKKSVIVLEN